MGWQTELNREQNLAIGTDGPVLFPTVKCRIRKEMKDQESVIFNNFKPAS
ncbi:hypothetical protein ACFLTP_08045 [Chloroflexota bacterium]